jgi:hypothetical protein
MFNSTTIKRTSNDDNAIWFDDVIPVFPPHEIDGQALWNQYKAINHG